MVNLLPFDSTQQWVQEQAKARVELLLFQLEACQMALQTARAGLEKGDSNYLPLVQLGGHVVSKVAADLRPLIQFLRADQQAAVKKKLQGI